MRTVWAVGVDGPLASFPVSLSTVSLRLVGFQGSGRPEGTVPTVLPALGLTGASYLGALSGQGLCHLPLCHPASSHSWLLVSWWQRGGGPASFRCLLPQEPQLCNLHRDLGLVSQLGVRVWTIPLLPSLRLGLTLYCPHTPGWAPQLCPTCLWGAGVCSQLGPTPQGRGVQGGATLGPGRSADTTACAVLPGPARLGAGWVPGDRIVPHPMHLEVLSAGKLAGGGDRR